MFRAVIRTAFVLARVAWKLPAQVLWELAVAADNLWLFAQVQWDIGWRSCRREGCREPNPGEGEPC